MATGRHFSSGHEAPNQNRPKGEAVGVRPVRAAAVKNAPSVTRGKRKVAGTSGPRRPRWNKPAKPAIVVALVAALALVGVGGVLAWLVSTDSLTNEFGIGEIGTEVTETFNGTTKSDVAVTNKGNIEAWIRAQINIYWVDANGNQMWDKPVKDTDYTLTMGSEGGQTSGWLQGQDGYYYYTSPVAPNANTGNLITSLTDNQTHSDGRKLVCDIAAQAIQADPYSAVEDAWGVFVTEDVDGNPSLTLEEGQVITTPTQSATTESEVA